MLTLNFGHNEAIAAHPMLVGSTAQTLKLDFEEHQTAVNVLSRAYFETMAARLMVFVVTGKIIVVVTGCVLKLVSPIDIKYRIVFPDRREQGTIRDSAFLPND